METTSPSLNSVMFCTFEMYGRNVFLYVDSVIIAAYLLGSLDKSLVTRMEFLRLNRLLLNVILPRMSLFILCGVPLICFIATISLSKTRICGLFLDHIYVITQINSA